MRLSESSVAQAAAKVRSYAESLEGKCSRLCEELAAIGVEAAVATVRKDTGALAGTIRYEQEGPSEFLVVCDGEYAAFVEFGTGVVGQGTYPGGLPASWGYDERRTPAAHDPDDPTRWFYRDADGNVRSTRGQTANAFMATAAEEMRQSVLSVAREVFGT